MSSDYFVKIEDSGELRDELRKKAKEIGVHQGMLCKHCISYGLSRVKEVMTEAFKAKK